MKTKLAVGIAVLVLIGAGGYWYWQYAAGNNDYLVIKEWGVEFKKPAGMEDLQYKLVDSSSDFRPVSFTTQKLVDLDRSAGGTNGRFYCTVEYNPIGVLARSAGVPGSSTPGYDVSTSVKVGEYYYVFIHPQAACSDNKEVQALESQQMADLLSTGDTLRAATK